MVLSYGNVGVCFLCCVYIGVLILCFFVCFVCMLFVWIVLLYRVLVLKGRVLVWCICMMCLYDVFVWCCFVSVVGIV